MESELCIRMLKALADQTRWAIVRELLKETLTVGEITERVAASQYNVSKHIRILREAGIIVTSKSGKSVNCRVVDAFRQRFTKSSSTLDLGCCAFHFDKTKAKPRTTSAPN